MSQAASRRVPAEQLAALLAAGLTQQEAAAEAGCSRATITRRLRDPAFRDLVDQYRRRLIAETSDRLAAAARSAVDVLRAIAEDGDAPRAVRVSAARVLIERAPDWRKLSDHEQRIARLENRAVPGRVTSITSRRGGGRRRSVV